MKDLNARMLTDALTCVSATCSYLRPVRVNEAITITARTLSCGQTLAVCCVDISHTETGKLVAQGRHSKFVGQPKTVQQPAV